MGTKKISTCPVCKSEQIEFCDGVVFNSQCRECWENLTIIPLAGQDHGWYLLTLSQKEAYNWQRSSDFRGFMKWLKQSREQREEIEERKQASRLKRLFLSMLPNYDKRIAEVG